MSAKSIVEWEGREYDHNPKSGDWYWALGIVAVAGAIAAVLFGNFLLALLVIVAAAALALHATKEPPIHSFRLVDTGLLIGEDFHPYERMRSFTVLEDIEGEYPPLLSIKTASWHSPHLVIPLKDVDADLIYAHFLHNVEEADHRHSLSDLVAAWLGF